MSEVAIVSDVAAAAAELFLEATAGAAAARGRAAVALTGGSSAAPLYARLRGIEKIPWRDLQIFFTDERAVPPDDELSNFAIFQGVLGGRVASAQVHRLRGEARDLDEEARRAAREMRETLGDPPRFDLMLLGLGPDGHVLSLFAGVPGSAERGDDELVRHVEAPQHIEPRVERLTLIPFLLLTARMAVLQVAGEKKAPVLARALEGPEDLVGCPAQWLRHAVGRVVVVCDEAAASQL
ncbi:MAG: 6-phosphogluconolactonase [Deltaproteobacteria bacterium]|nr:MAG: 6-phosphogluconolactonase [Deltaproteobacteria bacterium]